MQLIPLLMVISWRNFAQGVAHNKTIPRIKQNSEICTAVVDNDVILLEFERFLRKALSFKRLYLSSLWIKHVKNW